jgi:hypothetical protein
MMLAEVVVVVLTLTVCLLFANALLKHSVGTDSFKKFTATL